MIFHITYISSYFSRILRESRVRGHQASPILFRHGSPNCTSITCMYLCSLYSGIDNERGWMMLLPQGGCTKDSLRDWHFAPAVSGIPRREWMPTIARSRCKQSPLNLRVLRVALLFVWSTIRTVFCGKVVWTLRMSCRADTSKWHLCQRRFQLTWI